jgi:hypothetical protein
MPLKEYQDRLGTVPLKLLVMYMLHVTEGIKEKLQMCLKNTSRNNKSARYVVNDFIPCFKSLFYQG